MDVVVDRAVGALKARRRAGERRAEAMVRVVVEVEVGIVR